MHLTKYLLKCVEYLQFNSSNLFSILYPPVLPRRLTHQGCIQLFYCLQLGNAEHQQEKGLWEETEVSTFIPTVLFLSSHQEVTVSIRHSSSYSYPLQVLGTISSPSSSSFRFMGDNSFPKYYPAYIFINSLFIKLFSNYLV